MRNARPLCGKDRHKAFAFERDFANHYVDTSGGNVRCGVPVMIPVAAYRRRAEHCEQRSKVAKDDYHRKIYSQLAEMWTEMAEKAEHREATQRREIDDALATIQRATQQNINRS